MNKTLKFSIIFLLDFVFKYVLSTTYTCSSSSPCGCSTNPAVLTKIVGGELASSQTWGWAVSLRVASTNSHFCGGSIISESHILTAAHCAKAVSSIRVYAGTIYISDVSSTTQIRTVSKTYIHPNYSTTTYVNDLAILKLSSPIDLTQKGVDIVCLPNVSSTVLAKQEYPLANTNLIAIGWGYTSEGGSTSTTLQQVTIQSIAASSIYCRNMQLEDSSVQFCAGTMPNGGKDTCQGDSGGPLLMFNSNNTWEQVGITSVGYGCARATYPGIYTRVGAFQTWINETMNHGNHIHDNLHIILFSVSLLIVFQFLTNTQCIILKI